MATQEALFFQDENVIVTNARVVIDAKTYAMANITSVVMGEARANRSPGTIIFLVGMLIAVVGTQVGSIGLVLVFFGILILLLGIVAAIRAKPKYVVIIESASGETNALVSTNRTWIQKIVNAINEAIIKRG